MDQNQHYYILVNQAILDLKHALTSGNLIHITSEMT